MGSARQAAAFANYVYHERTSNLPECGSDPWLDVASPTPGQAVNLRWKVEYQFSTDHTVIYYTTDGSRPAGSFGVPSGTTQIAQGTYLCTFNDGKLHLVDIVGGVIPGQPAGTTVKYIIGAWHSQISGPEIFGNSGTCGGCGDFESSTRATLFEYTIAAPLTITCPPDLTDVPTDPGQCYATGVALGSAVASDTSPGTTVVNNAPTQFPKGQTVVTWTVTTSGGKQATCTQNVTVADHEKPIVTCPSNVQRGIDAGKCTAVVSGIAPVSISDNCAVASVTYQLSGATVGSGNNDASGTVFNRGVTTVTYTITDTSGNVNSASFTVTVTDTEPPVILSIPANLTVSCPSEVPAANDSAVVASDNCSGQLTVTHDSDQLSGALCPNHFTISRTYRVSDANSNSSSATQTITVNDTVKPVVVAGTLGACYATQTEAESAALAVTTATDNCSASPAKTVVTTGDPCNATITVTATDGCGNSDSVVYHTRIDNQPPVVANVSASQNGTDVKNCVAGVIAGTVNISVQVTDNCSLAGASPTILLVNGSDSSAATFAGESPAGTFNYTWSIGSTTANGTWTATVSASDLCHTTTSSFTLCVNKTRVTGAVQSEGFVGGNRTVTFVATGGSVKTWVLNLAFVGDTAGYTLTDVPAGTTAISAKTAWSLREKLPVTLDDNGQAMANFVSDGTPGWNNATDHYLRGGDFTGNNVINFQDYSLLGNSFFTFNTVADITGDGQVDYDDYWILFVNWLTAGDTQ